MFNKKKYITFILFSLIIFQLSAMNKKAVETSLLYFIYQNNDYFKNGIYECTKYNIQKFDNYYEFFQGFQYANSDDKKYEQYEFKSSYDRYIKKYLKIGFDLKYTKVVNGVFDKAILGGITVNIYVKNFNFNFSPAINYSFDGIENKIYQLSGKISYKFNDYVFSGSTHLFTVRNNDISEEKIKYFHEGSIAYFSDKIGIYNTFSLGEKYLLTTFDNTYLNLSPDEFINNWQIGVLYYPILRNWSLNYEFRFSNYKFFPENKYFIKAHLINVYFSW